MSTKVINLSLDEKKRMIFISDIHGNISLFKELLTKVNFSDDDYLFVLGDMIEKSNNNLQTLDYFMNLSKKSNVYIICGNCDNVLSYMIKDVDDKLLKHYALKLKRTILLEFANKLNIRVDDDTNMEELCNLSYTKFKKYYDFVLNLPHAYIINNKICAVHGGIESIKSISNNPLDLMKNDCFYEKTKGTDIIEIVGHYPVVNYQHQIPSLNPIIDLDKKIISIDGGVSVLPWAQMNALLINNINTFEYTTSYVDSYQKIRVIMDTNPVDYEYYNVTHSPVEVNNVIKDGDFFVANHKDYKLFFPKDNLIEKEDRFFVYNAFNYFIKLKKDDVVSLVYKGKSLSIVKKNGVVGICETKCLEV